MHRSRVAMRRLHLDRLYTVRLVLCEHPGASGREIATLCALPQTSTFDLIRELRAYGLLTYATLKNRSREVHIELHRLGRGRVGFWIGD